MTHTLR